MSQTHVPTDGAAKPVARGNQRATIRYRCAPATLGKIYLGDDQEFQRACVLDLSVRGIGLQISRRLELGTFLLVSVRSNDRSITFELYAQVVRCAPLPLGEWIVGCELAVPLTAEDLDHLL